MCLKYAIFLTTLCGLVSSSALFADTTKPNVILFMADDMGMGDTSAYQDFTGNADTVQLHTPEMERLASLGLRFTDAHTPSSRCTPTRYGLLTGRYPWRNRLKYWVLFGSQGDPLIEPDRPTLANLFVESGYATGLVGKWHVGLRYRNAEGKPAAGFLDADITKPLHTTPLDHGFEYCRFTSRSHATSGPDSSYKNGSKHNTPDQNRGPGHIHGRIAVGATGEGRKLVEEGPNAYVLKKLGSRHYNEAMEFIEAQVAATKPFFLYYPANSNHGPYTPDDAMDGKKVSGASKTKSGTAMDARHDYIYENDVALGKFLNYLEQTDDPRNPGKPLLDNTLVIFTSDNGAEKNSDIASGPFRSNKGSVFEGGHRVPFIVSWKAGGISPGSTSAEPVGLIDLYASFSEVLGIPLPDLRSGAKGGEDSQSLLPAWRGEKLKSRAPLFFNDHKEAKADNAVVAIRLDNPTIEGKIYEGQWKQFFSASLLRQGVAEPFALYDLSRDQQEQEDKLADPKLKTLSNHLSNTATLHRNSGGVRYTEFTPKDRVNFRWGKDREQPTSDRWKMTIRGANDESFDENSNGLGLVGNQFKQVDNGESLLITFDRDVLVESVGIVAGNGTCGGFYQVGDKSPLAIYCIDADNDAKDQQGLLSDIGVLKKGEALKLDSSPHYGVEATGAWRLQSLSVRILD